MKRIIIIIAAFLLFAPMTVAAKPLIFNLDLGTAEYGEVDGNGDTLSGSTTAASGTSNLTLNGNGYSRKDSRTILSSVGLESTIWTLEVSAVTKSIGSQSAAVDDSTVTFAVQARTFNDADNRTVSKTTSVIASTATTSSTTPQQVSFTLPWARHTEFQLVTGSVALEGFNALLIANIPDDDATLIIDGVVAGML